MHASARAVFGRTKHQTTWKKVPAGPPPLVGTVANRLPIEVQKQPLVSVQRIIPEKHIKNQFF